MSADADLFSLLRGAALAAPRAVCIAGDTAARTYGEELARVENAATFLRARGVRRGDRISILADNSAAFYEAYFAAAALGAILNPINTRLAAAERGAIVCDAEPTWLVADPRFADAWPELSAACPTLRGVSWTGPPTDDADWEAIATAADQPGRPLDAVPGGDAIAHLYYTSGSTGEPKGVMLTHRNVHTHARAAIDEFGLGAGDTWGHFAPMFHLADAWAVFAITAAGGRHVFQPRFTAAGTLAAIERHRVTLTNLVPTMLAEIVDTPTENDLSSVRLVLSGGAPITRPLIERVTERFGCEYAQTYGMTETSPYLTIGLLPDALRDVSPQRRLDLKCKTGRPFAPVELRVVDSTGQPIAANGRDVGEIIVRGPTVTPGYWRRPDATAAAIIGGWLHTGDLATLDADGFVDIVDRRKDMIITGGENVFSIEVEKVLCRHPAVSEAAVFGRPDPKWGEVVVAVVTLRSRMQADAGELIGFCRERLSRFKVPRVVEVVGRLPRLGSGKVAKGVLRGRG